MSSYLVLARKYRPATFSDVVGQDHVVRTLSNSILSGRVAHAFLFCGVRGVGKTTVARVLAKALNCSGRDEMEPNPCNNCSSCREIASGISVDVQEIDGASHTSVDNIREINENIKYPPVGSPFKIIIIDEVHMISINAFNALLKTLEEPPSHAKFIFATTESHKVPATITSRCQRFNFRTISMNDMIGGMTRILEQEGIHASEEALALVAREASGSFRDALSLLDQVIGLKSDNIAAADVVEILGIAGRDSFGKLVSAILDRNPADALTLLHELFRQGYDPDQFVLDMIQYLRNLIVVKTVPAERRTDGMIDAPPSEIAAMEEVVRTATPEDLQNLFGILLKGENEIKRSGNPWIASEMTVLRMSYSPQLVDLAQLVRRIDDLPSSPSPPTKQGPPPALGPKSEAAKPPRKAAPQGSRRKKESAGEMAAQPEPDVPANGFTITGITPLASGPPDEVWAALKERIKRSGVGPMILSLMDHGSLISNGPTQVEIGFHKAVYKESFEQGLKDKQELREIFQEFFGDALIKTLTLATETSLHGESPYAPTEENGTDLERALKNEAMDNPVVKAVLAEFEGSFIEDIRLTGKF